MGVRQWMKHSLVGDAPEHNVIQQGDLLGELHGRQRLETFCFWTFCLQHTHTHTVHGAEWFSTTM